VVDRQLEHLAVLGRHDDALDQLFEGFEEDDNELRAEFFSGLADTLRTAA